MDKDTPILAICAYGIDRSGALKKILVEERYYCNVLNCGVKSVTADTLDMLATWADHIYVVGERALVDQLPQKFYPKTIHMDIGVDIWESATNPALLDIVREEADKAGL